MIRRLFLGTLAALLAACGSQPEDMIEPAPAPGAEGADRLMNEAVRAAGNAEDQAAAQPANVTEGEAR